MVNHINRVYVIVCRGGAQYDVAPTVEIDAPSGGGQAATAEAYVEDGRVARIEVMDQGSGYVLDERPGVSIQRQNT